jgi:hypothetical protein
MKRPPLSGSQTKANTFAGDRGSDAVPYVGDGRGGDSDNPSRPDGVMVERATKALARALIDVVLCSASGRAKPAPLVSALDK